MAATAIYNSFLLCYVEAKYRTGVLIRLALELLCMLQCVIPRGEVGRERVGTAFPHSFHVLLKTSWKLFKNGYFLDAFPYLFCFHYIPGYTKLNLITCILCVKRIILGGRCSDGTRI